MRTVDGVDGTKVMDWRSVWNLYLEYGDVFRDAVVSLRRRGLTISDEVATDLIHEFLLERAPKALATFQPDRGALRSWLFVVFRRFVVGTLRSRDRRAQLNAYVDSDRATTTSPSPETQNDLQRVRAALEMLPLDQQNALRAYLADERASLRHVARTLGVSRWTANQLVDSAIGNVALSLGLAPLDQEARTHVLRTLSKEEI